MKTKIIPVEKQAYGQFNGGDIKENKPIGFNKEGGELKPYSNLFYWANAWAEKESTIGLHPHQGFEIMSFVLAGQIRHFDTKLNSWVILKEGDVQIIRSGNGISHAEHMENGSRMFQIWFDPGLEKSLKKEASYNDYKSEDFSKVMKDQLSVIEYSGKESPLEMDSHGVKISRLTADQGMHQIDLLSSNVNSFYILSGEFYLGDEKLTKDDFMIVEEAELLQLRGSGSIFLIESPVSPGYITYSEMMQQKFRN